jgi:hypothetical protein
MKLLTSLFTWFTELRQRRTKRLLARQISRILANKQRKFQDTQPGDKKNKARAGRQVFKESQWVDSIQGE